MIECVYMHVYRRLLKKEGYKTIVNIVLWMVWISVRQNYGLSCRDLKWLVKSRAREDKIKVCNLGEI